jgi:heme-degrading monooxygenase HmoA
MFMRMLQVKVKDEEVVRLGELYAERIIPALQKTEGCLNASLIRSVRDPEECISMTLWTTRQHAEAYGRSDLYKQLLEEARPYFADSSEFTMRLSKDLKLEYLPSPVEPELKSYAIPEKNSATPLLHDATPYVRIASAHVKHDRLREFISLYNETILPILHGVKGCRYAYLSESVKEEDQLLSVTIWDSEQDAENYELSGLFEELQGKLQDTFVDVLQWKMQLRKQSGATVVTSEDSEAEMFSVVSSKSFL